MVKTLCVGNVYCGKTSLVRRYARNTFQHGYTTSIGVDFMLKNLTVEGQTVKVQVWDVAGQDRFAGLSRAFYMFSNGAIVVFDLRDRASFEAAARWKKDIDDKIELRNGQKIPVLLLGNKCDLFKPSESGFASGDHPCVSEATIDAFVREHSFYKYYPTSALDGTNVQTAIDDLVHEIVRRTQLPADPASAADTMTTERYHSQGETKSVDVKSEKESDSGCC